MLLAFVDESDGSGLHCFSAVLGDELAVRDLTAQLNAIMAQAAVDYGLTPTVEIHAHPMFHGKGDWSGVPPRARVALFRKVVEAIVGADVRVLLRAVHDARLKDRQDRAHYPVNFPPEQVCFQHILQRVNNICLSDDTYALLIADERGDRERHRERFATYQTEGTPGVYMRTTLERLLDTVHFAPSHHSRMLQAADMLAFLFHRRCTIGDEPDARAEKAMAGIWASIWDSGCTYEPGTWP